MAKGRRCTSEVLADPSDEHAPARVLARLFSRSHAIATDHARGQSDHCPISAPRAEQANAQFLSAWPVVISRNPTHTPIGLKLSVPLVLRCGSGASFLPPAQIRQAPGARKQQCGGRDHASSLRRFFIYFANCHFRFCRLRRLHCRKQWEFAPDHTGNYQRTCRGFDNF